jgi:phenylacetate-coenzyme A ligase PaaK-like adenylate-forming protein
MRSLSVEIEVAPSGENRPAIAAKVSQQLREALGLTVPIHIVESGTLPRFEVKARRFIVEG